jgi:hypothetical protein
MSVSVPNCCLVYENSHFVSPLEPTATRTATSEHYATEYVTNSDFKMLILLVPGGGLEPPRPCGLRILSPLRLPISPSGQKGLRHRNNCDASLYAK